MAEIIKTAAEIENVIGDTMENPDKFPGMSYTDGVSAALRWVLGETDEYPMED